MSGSHPSSIARATLARTATALLALAVLALTTTAATAHPDIPREWPGGPGAAVGFGVDEDGGLDPVGGSGNGVAPVPEDHDGNMPDVTGIESRNKDGCVNLRYSGRCARPTLIDLSQCTISASNQYPGKRDCGAWTWVYDHNRWNGGYNGDQTTWKDYVHMRQCSYSDCDDSNFDAWADGRINYEETRSTPVFAGNTPYVQFTWPPQGSSAVTDSANDYGYRVHPSYESHHTFFLMGQTQDYFTHVGNQYCKTTQGEAVLDTSWRNDGIGDCSFPNGGYFSSGFDSSWGNCSCPWGFPYSGKRDNEGPFRPNWDPWRPAKGGIWHRTNRNNPFPSVNHVITEDPAFGRNGLYVWYSDRDGQQWPWEGVDGSGEADLHLQIREVRPCAGACFDPPVESRGSRPEQGRQLTWTGQVNRPVVTPTKFSVGGGTTYIPNGTYQWTTWGEDHHGVRGPASAPSYFRIYTPGARQCDIENFRYLCDLPIRTTGLPGLTRSFYDDTGPDGFSVASAPSTTGPASVFEFDLLTNPRAGGPTVDAANCVEQLRAGSTSLSFKELNSVMRVRVNLNEFDVNYGGAKSRTALKTTLPVGQRDEDATYLEGLSCIQ